MALTIRELAVKLGLDVQAQQFAKGQLAVEGIKFALGEVVGKAREMAGAFVESIKSTIEAAGEMDAAADSVGLTTERLQRLEGAAEVSGASANDLRAALKALKGEAGGADAAFLALADKVSALPPGAAQAEAAVGKLGEAGRRLVPLLAGGSAEVERLASESAALSREQVDAAVELSRAQSTLTALVRQFYKAALGPLLPVLAQVVRRFVEWKKANEAVARTRIAEAMTVVARVLETVWHALEFVLKVAGRLADSLKFIGRMLYDKIAAGFKVVYERAKQALTYLEGKLKVVVDYFTGPDGIRHALQIAAALFTVLGLAGEGSALKTALSWGLALAKFTAIAGVLAALYLAFDDVATYQESIKRGGTGKNTIYGKWKTEIDAAIGQLKSFLADWFKPKAEDPWWLRAIKELVGYLAKALGIAEKLDLVHPGAGGGVPRGKSSAAATATRFAGETVGGWLGLNNFDAFRNFWARQREAESATGSFWQSFAGGLGFTPTVSAPAQGGGGAQPVQNIFQVTQLPGEDGEHFAQRVAALVDERLTTTFESAASAIPATQ